MLFHVGRSRKLLGGAPFFSVRDGTMIRFGQKSPWEKWTDDFAGALAPQNRGDCIEIDLGAVRKPGEIIAKMSAITITVNSSGPAVSLEGSEVYFTSSPGTLIATVTGVNPGALTTLTLNGASVPARMGVFAINANLVEGANQFTLVATDNQSRTAQATTTVYLDSVHPTVSITAPPNNSSFNTTRVNVQGTFTEASLKQITVNNVLANVSGNTFEA